MNRKSKIGTMADAAVAPAKKPSAMDKMKKKIQGREEFKVVTEEGGLLSEVQKVAQANVSGGTHYKVSRNIFQSSTVPPPPLAHSRPPALPRCSTPASSPSG